MHCAGGRPHGNYCHISCHKLQRRSTTTQAATNPAADLDIRLAIVNMVLLVLTMSNLGRCLRAVFLAAAVALAVGACSSDGTENAQQVATLAPTAVPTTPPLTVPTVTPIPTPTPVPEATATPVPSPTAAPTATPEPEPTATAAPVTSAEDSTSDTSEPAPTAAPTATPAPAPTEAPTPLPTPIPTATPEAGDSDTPAGVEPLSTTETTPTAVVVTAGEPPLECYDPVIAIYRAFVDGVDSLSFDGGKVTCVGAATNRVSAARSYRHSSDLVISRNNNYIFNSDNTGYINFSGAVHFCLNGQASSAPIQSATVPSLLNVIEAEVLRQLGQGATGPSSFSGTSQC